MRILLIKLMLPCVIVGIVVEPFIGVLFFMGIAFVRLEVLTWGMVDARFALTTSLVTLGSWLIRLRDPKYRAERVPVQVWLYILLLFAITLTTVFAEESHTLAWTSNQKFLKYGLFLLMMFMMTRTVLHFRLIQEVLFWGVNFLAVWGTDQYFRGNYRLENVGGGDFADSSGLAALFNLTFPMAFYRCHHPNRWIAASGYVFGLLYLAVIVFTQSRSGFLGVIVSILWMFSRSKHRLRWLTVAIPLLMALPAVLPESFVDRMGTITSKEDEETGEKRERSADQRLKVWAVAWAVFKDHPILGVGRGNFGLVHSDYAYPIWYGRIEPDLFEDLFLRYRVCHSIFLDLLVSGGLATFVPWLLLVFSVSWSLHRMRKKLGWRQIDAYWRYQSYGLEIGIWGFIITGIFQDLAELEVFYWICLLGGLMAVVVEKWLKEYPPPPEPDGHEFLPARPVINGITPPLQAEGPPNAWHGEGSNP